MRDMTVDFLLADDTATIQLRTVNSRWRSAQCGVRISTDELIRVAEKCDLGNGLGSTCAGVAVCCFFVIFALGGLGRMGETFYLFEVGGPRILGRTTADLLPVYSLRCRKSQTREKLREVRRGGARSPNCRCVIREPGTSWARYRVMSPETTYSLRHARNHSCRGNGLAIASDHSGRQ